MPADISVFKASRVDTALIIFVPVAFGLLSLVIGQDANWDLRNYHLYNAWAFLTGRLDLDLAPAGLPTYFNPLLDVPFYWLVMHSTPMVTGFMLGFVHGLNFLLLFSIVHQLLPTGTERKVVVFLALSGCLGATFLSELGKTMGDDTTAPFILGGIFLILRRRSSIETDQRGGALVCLAAGVVAGLGIGLKLTNAPYAIGILAGLATLDRSFAQRRSLMAFFGAGIVAGILVTGGYWFATMWLHFGNPVFPQFNSIFHSDMATAVSIVDTRWRVTHPGEALFFPYVFTLIPWRISEIAVIELLWPVVYTLFGVWLVRAAIHKFRRRKLPVQSQPKTEALSFQARFILLFFGSSYLVWMAVFGIGRYAVSMEVFLPVVTWIILHRIAAPARARMLARAMIIVAILFTVIRFATWGDANWADKSYRVNVLPITHPENATVLILVPPIGWILPYFPPELAFVSFDSHLPGTSFPESEAYRRRADSMIHSRRDLYVVIPVSPGAWLSARVNGWLTKHGMGNANASCRIVKWLVARIPVYVAMLGEEPNDEKLSACIERLAIRRDLESERRQVAATLSASIADRGLSIDIDSCVVQAAFIGKAEYPYQFCRVRKMVSATDRSSIAR